MFHFLSGSLLDAKWQEEVVNLCAYFDKNVAESVRPVSLLGGTIE